ncbi:MAG: hypothetical protein M3371_13655 [Acidobacteriota bacterium]|nr:hypothetical protein [Acidobacteriota bacterium]
MKRSTKKTKKAPARRKDSELAARQPGALARVDASSLYHEIHAVLDAARDRATRIINVEMARAYWLVGQAIVKHEQQGKDRAGYGERLIEFLTDRRRSSGRAFRRAIYGGCVISTSSFRI